MAFDGYYKMGSTEIANLARVAAYGENLGLESVFLTSTDYAWMLTALGSAGYTTPQADVAPWYDPDFAASAQFGGCVILSADGLEDSSRTSAVTEFTDDGGSLSASRAATKTVVFTAALVGVTEAACEYGLRWLKAALTQNDCSGTSVFCTGQDMTFWRARFQGTGIVQAAYIAANQVHHRNVGLTRAPTVTKKRVNACDAVWFVSWTVVAADPYQYGVASSVLAGLGVSGNPYVAPATGTTGTTSFTEAACPVSVWDPIYDPLYPAASAPPAPPNFLPDGWNLAAGTWDRDYAEIPANLIPLFDRVAPIITIKSPDADARMFRVRVYPITAGISDVCTPIWECIISYAPMGYQFIIDGVQKAVYVWDGVSANVRRADSLAFGPNAGPIQWPSFSCGAALRITLEQDHGSDEQFNLSLDLSLTAKGE